MSELLGGFSWNVEISFPAKERGLGTPDFTAEAL